MSNINRNEIIGAVAMHDIRWIRKNFYSTEFEDELAVNTLIIELSEYSKAQDKEKESKLPRSLLAFFDKHYIDNVEAIETLKENLIYDFIIGKRILLLHENLKSEHIIALKKKLRSIIDCEVYELFELGQDPKEFISSLQTRNKVDFVFYCLSNSKDAILIISMLMYLIGHFGKENVCVVYDTDNENKEISAIMNKWNISHDSYIGLGL